MISTTEHITSIIKYRPGVESLLHTDLTTIFTTPEDIGCFWFTDIGLLCNRQQAVGLAANQLNVKKNFFFIAGSAKLTPAPVGHICIRPSWEPHRGHSQVTMTEGCKSLVGQYTVERWTAIDAFWTSTRGHRIRRTLKGYAAQVFQHEHDHLRGITLMESGSKI